MNSFHVSLTTSNYQIACWCEHLFFALMVQNKTKEKNRNGSRRPMNKRHVSDIRTKFVMAFSHNVVFCCLMLLLCFVLVVMLCCYVVLVGLCRCCLTLLCYRCCYCLVLLLIVVLCCCCSVFITVVVLCFCQQTTTT